jgi:hypothetical protein
MYSAIMKYTKFSAVAFAVHENYSYVRLVYKRNFSKTQAVLINQADSYFSSIIMRMSNWNKMCEMVYGIYT